MRLSELAAGMRTVVGIPVTPFGDDGWIDEEAYARLIHRIIDGGVSVITPNGYTSEFYALSPDEAKRGVDLTVDNAQGALVMAGVGLDISTAVDAARHAEQAGAPLVMVHQPVHPFQSADGWLAYHRAIAEAVPELGVVLYLRDPTVASTTLNRLFEACPNVVAIKYAVPDLVHFGEIVSSTEAGRVTWICGLAETWAPFYWVAGAQGFTSGLVNVAPQLSLSMLDHLRSGRYDAAMDVWRRVKPFEDLRARDRSALNVSVVKEALSQLGLCPSAVRPPISTLSPQDRAAVRQMLTDWEVVPPDH